MAIKGPPSAAVIGFKAAMMRLDNTAEGPKS
jgi:hypothetical protein